MHSYIYIYIYNFHIVNVTWASPSLAKRVREWVVWVNEESLSDHAYISMTVVDPIRGTARGRAVAPRQRRWALSKLNTDELLEAVRTSLWAKAGARFTSAEEEAKWLTRVLRRASDAAMPRAKRVSEEGKEPRIGGRGT